MARLPQSVLERAHARQLGGVGEAALDRLARLLGIGAAAGLALTWMAERVLRSLLFGVRAMDALTLAAAILTLALIAGVATLVPARRAARIDPLDAIRGE